MSRDALKELTDEVCERSHGNPGAINVMCLGVIELGAESAQPWPTTGSEYHGQAAPEVEP